MANLIAPRRGEFFTPDGMPTQRFITWIENLTTQSNDTVTEVINTNTREAYPWPVSRLASETSEFTYPAIQQEQKVFTAKTISGNYTALPFDFINARYNAQITFPQYPEENSVIIVRNGDGSTIKLSGNGKNINGSSTGVLQKQGTSIEFYYFIDSNEWFAK
jgi:hypothetical protein